MRNYIIVAPYDYEELNRQSKNKTGKLLVYLQSEEAIQLWKYSKHEVIFCSKYEYIFGNRNSYCASVARKAFDATARSPVIFVVLPYALMRAFLEQLDVVKQEIETNQSSGGVRSYIERLHWQLPFDPSRLFVTRVNCQKTTVVQWKYCLERYLMLDTHADWEIDEEFESIYTVLLSGDLSQLHTLSRDLLMRLSWRSSEDGEEDLFQQIKKIQNNKR